MEILSVENLGFTYEENMVKADGFSLKDINVSIKQGEMVLFCGPCGCGKTTFFRLLKEDIAPDGMMTGKIKQQYENQKIGYLFQNPEAQLVMETVEEELVFGAEQQGMKPEKIARSLAELSAYLGIEHLLQEKVTCLSGGQMQLVNLASILMMKPELLLLDEPLSQLDPVTRYDFMQLLFKVREDLGLTILVTEHNLDAFLPYVDKVYFMEEGSISFQGKVQDFLHYIINEKLYYKPSLPKCVLLYDEWYGQTEEYPLLPGQLRNAGKKLPEKKVKTEKKEHEILYMKAGYFRYGKEKPDVLKGMDVSLYKGNIYGIIGGNGAGKSTLFSVFSGYRKLYRGKCKVMEKVGILPQNPMYAFWKDELLADCETVAKKSKIQDLTERYSFCKEVAAYFGKDIRTLSGGQMQKAAIFKLLLGEHDVFLLDEPVKGMDGYEKQQFLQLLMELKAAGKTILIISHDLEFLELAADSCLLLFDGTIVAKEETGQMFENNRFYTTVQGRLRGLER